jgi:sodium/potassium-transporting ATPase subunit alpha
MASITTMLPDNCIGMRNGAKTTVVATEIVPGDILFFKSRNKILTDVRFVEISSDIKFNRLILTSKNKNLSLDITMTDVT